MVKFKLMVIGLCIGLTSCEEVNYYDKEIYLEVYNNCISPNKTSSSEQSSNCSSRALKVSRIKQPLETATYVDSEDGKKYCQVIGLNSGWTQCPKQRDAE